MDVPFWTEMVRSGWGGYGARKQFNAHFSDDRGAGPVWCFQRYRTTHTLYTPTDSFGLWVISIAGAHEDSYDPDFMIYNDVVVRDMYGGVWIYGYPRDVFPPVDGHTATLFEDDLAPDYILIVGGIGYQDEREWWSTPVFRLDLETLQISQIPTKGPEPGLIFGHSSVLLDDDRLLVSGGRHIGEDGEVVPNRQRAVLNITTMTWEQTSQ